MDIAIDHKIRIPGYQIPPVILEQLMAALEIPNLERQKAMEQNIWGWQNLPKTISLWHQDPRGNFVMPRGFLSDLLYGLDLSGHEFTLRDNRVYEPRDFPWEPSIPLRPWQEPAVEQILEKQDGIWKAPAGSGKTVGVLEAIRRVAGRAIVLVNTKDIMWQWKDRAKQFLGEDYPIGFIGDGDFIISDHLTIAMVQTLHARYEMLLAQGFFDHFTFMCLDECHHATAETFNRVVNSFSSAIRIGVSATPDKTGDFNLATKVLGPIFHETHKRDVSNLITPDVFRIPTNFWFRYTAASGRRPSNYPQLLDTLINDADRNILIIKSIMIEAVQDVHCLVITKRLEHVNNLAIMLKMAGYKGEMLRLTGKDSNEDRKRVVRTASEKPCVIFSTLADEALDIPRLDRLFLVFPQRNPGLITQQVGRVERKCDGKTDAKIFDFCDSKVGPLDAQWKIRRREVYSARGYHVQTAKPEQILGYEIK